MGNLRFIGSLAGLCLGGITLAWADYEWDDTSPLIHAVDEDLDPMIQEPTLGIAPWFQEFMPDFLHLVKRSYNATKRSDRSTYRLPAEMMQAQVDIGKHVWHCRQNFAGTQGAIRAEGCRQSCLRCLLNCCSCCCGEGEVTAAEIDFPGFVAYTQHRDLHVIVLVLRGSQGELFQSAHGIFGPTWMDNFFAARQRVSADRMGFNGFVHAGYAQKIQNFFWNLQSDLRDLIRRIPREERDRIRFVCTGHSQGAGLATLLTPQLIHTYGQRLFGQDFDNQRTPRFFCLALSSPMVLAGRESQEAFERYVGRSNVLRLFVHRDLVTLAAFRGYVPVGTPAIVSISDAIHRAIQADVSHHYRTLFYKKLRAQFDPARFDRVAERIRLPSDGAQDEILQVAKDEPHKKLYWHYIKFLLTSPSFHYDMITSQGFADVCNRARRLALSTSLEALKDSDPPPARRTVSEESLLRSPYRRRHSSLKRTSPLLIYTQMPSRIAADPEQITAEDLQSWMEPSFDWEEALRLARGDLLPEEITIDSERAGRIAGVADELERSVFRADSGRNFLKPADAFRDCLGTHRRLNAREPKVGTFPHDPEFLAFVGVDPSALEDRPYPLPGVELSLIATLHAGAQDGKEAAFHPHILNTSLPIALKNGQIEERKQSGELDISTPLLSALE
ncbi:MAG: hypothetical protein LBD54_00335 [Puniceicoccales bacterium]|jgi:hypothetical protein|nr:hypothetical protein [Puniceicoccales bacterium]